MEKDISKKIKEWADKNTESFNQIDDLSKIRQYLADHLISRLCFIRICQTEFTRFGYISDFLTDCGYSPCRSRIYHSLNQLRRHNLITHVEIKNLSKPKNEIEQKIKEYFGSWCKYHAKKEIRFFKKYAGFYYVSEFAKINHLNLFALFQSGILSRLEYEKYSNSKLKFDAEKVLKDWKKIN